MWKDGCEGRHHPLLHRDRPIAPTEMAAHSTRGKCGSKLRTGTDPDASVHGSAHEASKVGQKGVGLGVVRARVSATGGRLVWAEVLLDNASDTTLISEDFRKRCGLKRKKRANRDVLSGRGTGNQDRDSRSATRL